MASPLAPRFLPRDLIARTSEGSGRRRAVRFSGATLFVDIEGYTDLTERLTASGPEGVEKLSRMLNRAFARYVDGVRLSGGEIALFAGDALLAYWPAQTEGALVDAVARARACAEALGQRKERQATPDPDAFEPRLRMGLGAGQLWAGRLGPADVPELLFAGAAVREATRAKREAKPGELALGPTARGVLQGPAPDAEADLDDGVVSDDDVSAFLHWVPPAARRNGSWSDEVWLAERRHVVPLFVGFDGVDPHDPSEHPRLDALAATVREVVSPIAGAGGQLLVDDNGLIFLVVLGLPHASRGEEETRAAQLALAIRRVARQSGVGVRVGMARGPAFTGVLGGRWRSAYVTIGRPMNVAARLMNSAEDGEVRCTLDLATRAHGHRCVRGPDLALKGVREPVSVATVEDGTTSSVVVEGRARELADLCREIGERVGHEDASFLLVVGSAGIGKTALMRALVAEQMRLGRRVVLGGTGSSERLAGHAAVQPLLRHAFGIEPDAPRAVVDDQLRRHLDAHPNRLPLAALLNRVFGVEIPDSDETRTLRGKERAETLQRYLIDACAGILEPETLLVLEDLQWFDSASLRLLRSLSRRAPGVVVLASSRAGAQEMRERGLDWAPDVELQLGPLDGEGISALVSSLLGGGEVDVSVGQQIFRRSRGHPLLARLLALALKRRGALVRRDGVWYQPDADAASEDLSSDLQGLVSSRLDDLGAGAQLALKVASVVGIEFDVDLVERAMPTIEADGAVDSAIRELVDAQLIDPQGERRYSFEHGLVRDVTYELLLYEQRRGLHRCVARELESGTWAAKPADIYWHFDAAGEVEGSLKWADVAADDAMDSGAWNESIRLLSRCLELDSEPTLKSSEIRRIGWLRKLSESHGQLGHTGDRRARAHEALEIARPSRSGPVRRLPRWSRILLGGSQQELSKPALPVADGAAQLSRAHAQAALVAYFDNDMPGMIVQTLHAIDHAEQAGLQGDLARHYASLGGILGVAGAHRLGTRHLRRAAGIAEAARDVAAQVFVHLVQALYSVGRGDWTVAESAGSAGQRLADSLQLHSEWGNIQIVRFWVRLYRGELEDAEGFAEQLMVRSSESEHDQHQSWALRALGVIELFRGEALAAEQLISRSLEVPVRDGAAGEQMESLGSLALAQLRLGQEAEVRASVEQLVSLGRAVGRPTSHAQTIALGNAAHASLAATKRAPRDEQWARLHAELLGLVRRTARTFPVARPGYLLLRAKTDELRGRTGRARRGRAAALRAVRGLSMALPWFDDDAL